MGWQYSSKATIPGIGTKVDRNVFYKNYTEGEGEPMSKIEKAVQQMETWAKDNSHGYDQIYRWGEKGDYDCSAAVIQACQNAGDSGQDRRSDLYRKHAQGLHKKWF